MSAAIASAAPRQQRAPSFTWHPSLDHAVAGIVAGAASTCVCHPLDLIRTRLQIDESALRRGGGGKVSQLLGRAIRTTRGVVRADGFFKGLYRGLSPNLVGATSSWGLYFWWYELLKKRSQRGQTGRLGAREHLTASAQAGAIVAVLTNPIWVIKTRMCSTSPTQPGAYRSLLHGFITLVRTEGVRGLYRGMLPSLFGVSHGAIQFTVYEELKQWRMSKNTGVVREDLSTLEYIGMSTTSKLIATVSTYPYKVVRVRLQNQTDNTKYRGVLDTIVKVARNEGIYGFYKGIVPNTVRLLPGTVITFVVYENATRYMRHHAQ